MKFRNTTTRNISVLGLHKKQGGMPDELSILAGSLIELTKAEAKPFLKPLQKLFDAEVLKIEEDKVIVDLAKVEDPKGE